MKKIIVLTVVLVLALVAGCAAPAPTSKPAPAPAPTTAAPAPTSAPAQKVIELKFSQENQPTARTAVKFLYPWAKKIEEVANGKVKVTVYPGETLNKAVDALPSTEGGICDISWPKLAYYPGRFPLTTIFELPFTTIPEGKIDGKPAFHAAVNSRIIQELYETTSEVQAEWSKVKLLFIYTPGPNYIITKKPVRNQKDVNGLRLQVRAGPSAEAMKLLGVSPINTPASEMYEAIQKGVIDGVTMPWSGVLSLRLYEVLSYWTVESPMANLLFMVMNLDKWNSLPPDIQQALMSVSGKNGAAMGSGIAGPAEIEEAYDIMKKANKVMEEVHLDAGELAKWSEIAGKPQWDKYIAEQEAKGLAAKKVFSNLLALREKYK